MDEELSYYWKQIAHLDINRLSSICEDNAQPALKLGLAKALMQFAENGNFENLERIGDTISSGFPFDEEFDEDFGPDMFGGEMPL